jgi:hypothetical protein
VFAGDVHVTVGKLPSEGVPKTGDWPPPQPTK